jgi:hypothetical protein
VIQLLKRETKYIGEVDVDDEGDFVDVETVSESEFVETTEEQIAEAIENGENEELLEGVNAWIWQHDDGVTAVYRNEQTLYTLHEIQ